MESVEKSTAQNLLFFKLELLQNLSMMMTICQVTYGCNAKIYHTEMRFSTSISFKIKLNFELKIKKI